MEEAGVLNAFGGLVTLTGAAAASVEVGAGLSVVRTTLFWPFVDAGGADDAAKPDGKGEKQSLLKLRTRMGGGIFASRVAARVMGRSLIIGGSVESVEYLADSGVVLSLYR